MDTGQFVASIKLLIDDIFTQTNPAYIRHKLLNLELRSLCLVNSKL